MTFASPTPAASPRLVTSYADFATGLVTEGILSDPWIDGAPRFRMTPLTVDRATQRALYAAAEAVTALHDLAVRLCARDATLVDDYFDLPPAHRLMWQMGTDWHGIARADVFATERGLQVCELNSDTPSGEAEATGLSRVLAGAPNFVDDPNRELGARVVDLVEQAWARVRALDPGASADPKVATVPRHVAIMYPTELSEDLSLIELYARWFQQAGFRVVLGSPFNLHDDGAGGVAMFGVPCPVVWRHYKTDWWGERRPIWRSEPAYRDAAPLWAPLSLLAGACARPRVAVVNPFGAVLTQNKRMMALMWEQLARFPGWAQALIRRYVPLSVRMERLSRARLRSERTRWVLKSDYGCEGEEVVVGTELSAREWERAIAEALPGRWMAQRRFQAVALAGAGDLRPKATRANFGVYVVGGRAAGLFTRLQAGATDRRARSAATLVRLP